MSDLYISQQIMEIDLDNQSSQHEEIESSIPRLSAQHANLPAGENQAVAGSLEVKIEGDLMQRELKNNQQLQKDQKLPSTQLKKGQRQEQNELEEQKSDFVYVEQNACNLFQPQQQQPNNNQKYQEIISEKDSIVFIEEGDKLEPSQNSQSTANKPYITKRKSKVKFEKISPESFNPHLEQKITNKAQHLFEPHTITKNPLNEDPNQRTQDVLVQENVDRFHILQPINRQKQMRKEKRKLAPIQSTSNKITINTSGIITGNQSSLLVFNKSNTFAQGSSMTHLNSFVQPSENLAKTFIPSGKTLRCVLKRQKICMKNYYHPQFSLFLKDQSFIANGRKSFCNINSHYIITGQQSVYSEASSKYYATLVGNFVGTIFNLYDKRQNDEIIATIYYEAELSCVSTYQKMEVYLKDKSANPQDIFGISEGKNLRQLYNMGENASLKRIHKIVSKQPQWNSTLQCYTMNFRRKKILPSVKNMILVNELDKSQQALVFCKTDTHEFCLDISYPLTPLVSLAIVLSSFDFKLFCQ